MKRAASVLALALMAWVSVGCQATGNPLAGDKVESSKCPPGGCAGLDPDQSQISISGPGGTTLSAAVQVDSNNYVIDGIDIGGECYISTYPKSRIEVQLTLNGSAIGVASPYWVNSRRDPSVATAAADLTPRCINGRYGFSIHGGLLYQTGVTYRLKVTLIGIDANGNEFRNAGTGVYTINLPRQL